MFQYDPIRVTATWGGIPVQGYADGTFIMIEYDEDAVVKTVGSQGTVTATINGNRAATATLTLVQGSLTNSLFSPLVASARPRGAALVVRPFMLKDLNGETVALASEAWIQKMAPAEYGKDASNREWTIAMAELTMFNGGLLRGAVTA